MVWNSLYAVMHRLGFFFCFSDEMLPVFIDFPVSPEDEREGQGTPAGFLLTPSVGLVMVDDDGTNRPPDAMADERAAGIVVILIGYIRWCSWLFACIN